MATKPFDETSASLDPTEQRARLEHEGYLFIRQLVPAAMLEDLRIRLLSIARDGGWVCADRPLEEGVADLAGFCVEPEPRYTEVYVRMYRLAEFHALQHCPALVGLFERMFEEPILPHPRLIGRTIFPQREEFTTPAHQDFVPVQGAADTWTAWIPLSDVTPDLGGLEVCAGSHRQGIYDFRPALGAGGLEILEPPRDGWVGGTMRQGDVVIFHSHTIHRGIPNKTDRVRMSLDARFQRVSDPIAPDSLEPHGKAITWEEIYSGWASCDLQFYWRKWDMQISPYDMQYHERRDSAAFAMAEAGDDRARSALQRIIARDTDPAKRQRAEKLLAALDAAQSTDWRSGMRTVASSKTPRT